MQPADRARLTTALRDHVANIATDLRAKMQARGATRVRAKKLYADEQVAEDFDVWTDLLSRRAAVLWVLKSVYVRVLEDRGLLSPGRLLDPEAQQLFERLAPNLGETAFLRWVYRDLASEQGGVPELFSPQAAEVATVSDEHSRALIAFWRHRDADTGASWSFADERFEGELMGDLYQELDPVVKDRFALCQTPDFVREFILDRTLTPAIETFGADKVRLLDPACGSGHFLIDGLKRLVAATSELHSELSRRQVVDDCLSRVVGIDLNDYACALARARLVMTAADLAGVHSLSEAASFHPHVYWADGLEQVELGKDTRGEQLDLLDPSRNETARASLTRPEVRSALRDVLTSRFEAVTANPPYITETDDARKLYQTAQLGNRRRYVSAFMQYHLSEPFTERCFQLAVEGGFVGLIIDDSFMKKAHGRPLIQKVLARRDLSLIVDTSRAHIPHHGTPTVLLFARNQRPSNELLRAVLGKRGETGTPDEPREGRVWSSIEEGWSTAGFENAFVSVADVERTVYARHPWSLKGGGALQLKKQLEAAAPRRLGEITSDIGRTTVCGFDDVYVLSPDAAARLQAAELVRPLTVGETVRDWAIRPSEHVVYPYQSMGGEPIPPTHPAVRHHFWRYRALLRSRTVFGKSPEERGGTWFEHLEHYAHRLRTPKSIAYAFVATHNHFVLDQGGRTFKQTAPVIKLPADAHEDDYLWLLGLLNSSTMAFWLRQVCQAKGGESTGRKRQSEAWARRLEHDANKLKNAPVGEKHRRRVAAIARKLDRLAGGVVANSPAGVLASEWSQADLGLRLRDAEERRAELRKQMVAWQEELDWTVYAAFDLIPSDDLAPLEELEPMVSEHRPFAVRHARAASAGDATDYWFEATGTTPTLEVPSCYSDNTRRRMERRLELLDERGDLALLEAPEHKRKWEPLEYQGALQSCALRWLADRVEDAVRSRSRPATEAKLVAAVQDDSRFLSVASVLEGRRDVDVAGLVRRVLSAEAVPNHPVHVYTDTGLKVRAAWERVWELQRQEDAGAEVSDYVLPREYSQGSRGKPTDYLRKEFWKLRGKLDVPKERFVAFTEVPGRTGAETLYGWAGWTPLQRVRAILGVDEELEDAGVPIADRIGLLDSAWRLLSDVAREDAPAATRLKAELQALVGPDGPSKELLEEWRERFPPPRKARKTKRKSGKKKGSKRTSASETRASDES